MKRLGKFTGIVYNEDEVKTMTECGVMITNEQAEDEAWKASERIRNLKDCLTCMGCPKSKESIVR